MGWGSGANPSCLGRGAEYTLDHRHLIAVLILRADFGFTNFYFNMHVFGWWKEVCGSGESPQHGKDMQMRCRKKHLKS